MQSILHDRSLDYEDQYSDGSLWNRVFLNRLAGLHAISMADGRPVGGQLAARTNEVA